MFTCLQRKFIYFWDVNEISRKKRSILSVENKGRKKLKISFQAPLTSLVSLVRHWKLNQQILQLPKN